MAPGPTKPTAEEIQHYNMLVVNDLIDLYDNGVVYYSERFPKGHCVRVFLLAIICDHPAMCKMGGFAEKNHKVAPCPKCKVPLSELFSEKSLKNEFEGHNGEEHRRNCHHWHDLKTEVERKNFFDSYCVIDPMHNILLGIVKTQWYAVWIQGSGSALQSSTEKTPRELNVIHRFLEMFESPSWAGQLPARIGEPAGGSLTADEYRSALIGPLAIVIPIVWEAFIEDSQDQYECAKKRYDTALVKYKKELAAWERNFAKKHGETSSAANQQAQHQQPGDSSTHANIALEHQPPGESSTGANKPVQHQMPGEVSMQITQANKNVQEQRHGALSMRKKKDPQKSHEKSTPPKKPARRMQQDEPINFLCLATAVKLFLGRSITDDLVVRALDLLQDYLLEFRTVQFLSTVIALFSIPCCLQLYGEGAMKPNFHWVVHLPDQIRDYGPVYNFWAFLSERLNKILKSYRSNTWVGGQVEISMLREFERSIHLDAMINEVVSAGSPAREEAKLLLKRMLGDADQLLTGTAESSQNDELCALQVQAGPVASVAPQLSDKAHLGLFVYYNQNMQRVHYPTDHNPPSSTRLLQETAQFYDWALLDGRRITATSRTQQESAHSSIVKVLYAGKAYGGEVVCIFHHSQREIAEERLFAEFQWMKPLNLSPVQDDPWSEFPELEVETWVLGEFALAKAPGFPPPVLLFFTIQCQLSRGIVSTTNPKMWITMTMDRHASRFVTQS
ncbi:hypothetical protein SCP_1101320 [Sparassis crispa]|uniref:Uncharacterized protein n=1 Tax=Sparassis crispa TaxID=139825 RepID=A0A401GZ54_9APHY|nr:hypothetical protein SCP_1101320 [Sparassis crispa]GBE87456.1 hypothetical protein SCP_1101320 [Sparassis crispa]